MKSKWLVMVALVSAAGCWNSAFGAAGHSNADVAGGGWIRNYPGGIDGQGRC